MMKANRQILPPGKTSARQARGWAATLCAVLLLTACVPTGRRATDWQTEPSRATTTDPPPKPGSPCPPGFPPIGVLAVISDTVFRNSRPAGNGERVCNGDTITTNGSGVGIVLPDGDRESDSIHIAEGTDPRFTWTLGRCISVDGYNNGRIITTARRHCMVVRTPDTLILQAGGRVEFRVTRNTSTQVVPLRGSVTKLQPLSAQQVYTLSHSQLMQQAAPAAQQPQLQSLNLYTKFNVVRPAVRLPPAEIKRIDGSVLRRAVIAPGPDIR